MTPFLIYTSTNWTSLNTVLGLGEIGVESDTGMYKQGDGNTAWNSLPFIEQNEKYTTASGTNTYTADFTFQFSFGQTVTALKPGMAFRVKFTNANSGAATLNINSLGAITIKKSVSTDLITGDILAGAIMVLMYDGTNFQIISGGGGSPTGAAGGDLAGTYPNPTVNGLKFAEFAACKIMFNN